MSSFLNKVIRLISSDVHKTKLKAGDRAPQFTGRDQDGNTVSLNDFRGQRLVLFFYPKDHTMGCTAEACNLRDNYNWLSDSGYSVIGVSADNEESHRSFRNKYSLPFPLIADTELSIAGLFDVWGEKKLVGMKHIGMTRTTFVIDTDGIISQVITDVDCFDHVKQIVK